MVGSGDRTEAAAFDEWKLSVQTVQELEAVLSLDPRPAYQDDEARIYGMKFANLDVKFKVNETCIEIQEL
jgi:hypothetical protein